MAMDYISAEQFDAPAPVSHRILLGKGIPIIEGLLLEGIQAGQFDLIVLPMKVAATKVRRRVRWCGAERGEVGRGP